MTEPNYHQTAALALAKCAAYDPWFPKASQAIVGSWAEQIARYKLGKDDVLNGVAKMYSEHGTGFRPLPKDLTDAARAIRRDRNEQESDAERQAREDRHDAALEARNRDRLGDVVEEIGHRASLPTAPRDSHSPLTVPCPWCKAPVGRACTNANKPTSAHPSRVEALQAAVGGAA